MNRDIFEALDLEELIILLKNQEDEESADYILREFAENHNVDSSDLQEYLATDCNCCMCARCGRYFGEDEFSDNDEECIFCN